MTQDDNKTSMSTLIAIVTLILAIVAFIFGDNLYQQITGHSFFAADRSGTTQPTNTSAVNTPLVITATPNTPVVITSGTRVLAKLVVPANNNQGVTYDITESGLYTFTYSDSAASMWATNGAWSTSIDCFKGDKVIWNSTSLGDSPILFEVGDFKTYKTKDEAVQASKGSKTTLSLDAGEQITCVLADGKDEYFDNTGEVIVEVSVSP